MRVMQENVQCRALRSIAPVLGAVGLLVVASLVAPVRGAGASVAPSWPSELRAGADHVVVLHAAAALETDFATALRRVSTPSEPGTAVAALLLALLVWLAVSTPSPRPAAGRYGALPRRRAPPPTF